MRYIIIFMMLLFGGKTVVADEYRVDMPNGVYAICKSMIWAKDFSSYVINNNDSRIIYYYNLERCYEVDNKSKKRARELRQRKEDREAKWKKEFIRKAQEIEKEKKITHQKTPTIIMNEPKVITGVRHGTYTKPGNFACLKKQWIDDITQFKLNDDIQSVRAYVSTHKCLVIGKSLKVTLIDSPGIFGGTASFILNGTKFWTFREGLDYGY